MIGRYLGHLAHDDPLYGYLRDHIIPQLGVSSHHAGFRVFQSACSRHVYMYEEELSGAGLVGKFHPPHRNPDLRTHRTGETEYNNLVFLRGLGLDSPPHYVVKPLGFNAAIGRVLMVEYLAGDILGTVITDAIHLGKRDRLYRKLSALAHFLASMHNRTAGNRPVNFDHSHAYMGRLLNSLIVKRGMGQEDSDELYRLREAWRGRGCMWEDREVLVHGDVTPSNFLFGSGNNVMAIDLERMQWADRVFDLGRLCGELKHFFFQAKGDPHAAEPFIGHFLREYCRHFPDCMSAFTAITRRTPFYMGITLLRIARNSWIDRNYRSRLVQEAKQILRALP
ncbi:MAG: aminoglycoside phosphotransferase family protein [Pseudomonadota bacterium]